MAEAAQSGQLERSGPPAGEEDLLEALRRRDERAFDEVVQRWSGAMLRLARSHVASSAVAEEVVQEAWLVVLRDLDRFQRRSSLRTWVLGIVVNLARARGRAERRAVPLPAPDPTAPAIDPTRFRPPDADRWPNHWLHGPPPWPGPEEKLLTDEVREARG